MSDSFDEPIGLRTGISNEAYHSGPGISKSQLDLVHKSPSLLEWSKRAPVDEEAVKAVDLGSAFETLLLEPERFGRTYIAGPKNAPRNTKAGKDAWATIEAAAEKNKKTILTHDEWRKVHLMYESTMAHPVARRAFEAAALVQASYYWRDSITDEMIDCDLDDGLLCRCRPDWMLEHVPFVIDVKTSGQIDRFPASVEDYRYHVQDAFYSDGLSHYYSGERPSFAFVVVSTSLNAGRYPVHVYELEHEDKLAGRHAYKTDLAIYARCLQTGEFTHVEALARPWWARRRDDEL